MTSGSSGIVISSSDATIQSVFVSCASSIGDGAGVRTDQSVSIRDSTFTGCATGFSFNGKNDTTISISNTQVRVLG